MAHLTPRELRELRQAAADSGNRVSAAMRLKKLTQLQVAAGAGLTQQYISSVVRGRQSTVTVENARRLAAFFGCSIEDLFPAREERVAS